MEAGKKEQWPLLIFFGNHILKIPNGVQYRKELKGGHRIIYGILLTLYLVRRDYIDDNEINMNWGPGKKEDKADCHQQDVGSPPPCKLSLHCLCPILYRNILGGTHCRRYSIAYRISSTSFLHNFFEPVVSKGHYNPRNTVLKDTTKEGVWKMNWVIRPILPQNIISIYNILVHTT